MRQEYELELKKSRGQPRCLTGSARQKNGILIWIRSSTNVQPCRKKLWTSCGLRMIAPISSITLAKIRRLLETSPQPTPPAIARR